MFGCDEGSEGDPGYQIHCWACYHKPSKECPVCAGEGKFRLTKCPNRLLTPQIRRVWGAYSHYKAGFMPTVGGTEEQSYAFMEVVPLINLLFGIHEDIEIEKAKKGGK